MERWITHGKLIALAAFFVASAITIFYQAYYVWPVQRCEGRGAWWDTKDRQCLDPIPIWRITGRALAKYPAPVSGSPPGPKAHPPVPGR